MGHSPSAGITGWSPMHPGARRQRTLPRACLHPPGGARTPARRLISWGPPAIRPTRAHPQAHCSTEAPANTARRLGRGSMTSPATHFWGEVPPHRAALRWIAAALPTTYAKRPPPRPSLTARPHRRWRWLAPLGMSSLGCGVSRLHPRSLRRRTEAWRLRVRLSRLGRLSLCLTLLLRLSLTARSRRRRR